MEQPNIENKPERGERGPISKEFFELQFEFAKALFERARAADKEASLLGIIEMVAPALRNNISEYDFERGRITHDFEDADNQQLLVEAAYLNYLARFHEKLQRADALEGPSQKFGPVYYFTSKDEAPGAPESEDTVTFHFNLESEEGSSIGIDAMRENMKKMLQAIKERHPEVKTISGTSWLLDAIPPKAIKKLFPQAFLDSFEVREAKSNWGVGAMIWGQFLDVNGNVKKKLADELLKNVKGMKEEEYLIDLLRPPLYKPKSGIAPIEEFYQMYGV